MNKTKQFFYALLAGLLAFVLLIVGLMPMCQAAHTAHAQEEGLWDLVYYFSDSSQSESFCPPFLSNLIEEHYWDEDFQQSLQTTLWNTQYFNNITDSYFIFELSKGFQVDQGDSDEGYEPLPDVLEDIFADIKAENSNNKIMLILNTNENLFNSQTAFLEHVDIQINIDIMSVFMYSICDDINMLLSEYGYTNLTVFLSNYYFDEIFYIAEGKSLYQWYFEKYPFIDFVQFVEGVAQPEFPDIDYACVVGYADNFDGFSTWMYAICSSYSIEKAYVYDEIDWSAEAYDWITFEYCHNVYGLLSQTFPEIFYKFLNDEDLSEYNNFVGSADVNYFPIIFSSDGWLRIPEKGAVPQWDIYA